MTKTKAQKLRQKKIKQQQSSVPNIYGQGGYFTDTLVPALRKAFPTGTFAKAGSTVGGALGGSLGANFGQSGLGSKGGSAAGNYLGSQLARLVGFGDYSVQSNTLMKKGMAIDPGQSVPSFGVMGAVTHVRHREFIRDIVVPSSPMVFTNTRFVINPGDTTTFPLLASIAANFQQYKINGMVFEFKTLSSDITSGGALGSVILATNYNVLDASFLNKVAMENSQFSVSAKPSCSQIHTVECNPAESANIIHYVRDSASSQTSSQDARLYDLGSFQLATSGLPGVAGTVLGELWVSYDISLMKPILAPVPAVAGSVSNNAATKTNFFGSTPSVQGNAVSASGNSITFLKTGVFNIATRYIGNAMVTPTVTFTGTLLGTDGSTTPPAAGQFMNIFRVSASIGDVFTYDGSGSTSISFVTSYISTSSPTVLP